MAAAAAAPLGAAWVSAAATVEGSSADGAARPSWGVLAAPRLLEGQACGGTALGDHDALSIDACEALCDLNEACTCVAVRKSDGLCRLAYTTATGADDAWDACLAAPGVSLLGRTGPAVYFLPPSPVRPARL